MRTAPQCANLSDLTASRAIGAVVARFVHTEEVTGSNPVSPTRVSAGRRPDLAAPDSRAVLTAATRTPLAHMARTVLGFSRVLGQLSALPTAPDRGDDDQRNSKRGEPS